MIIQIKKYRQRNTVKTWYGLFYKDETHFQHAMVFEIWFCFILIYRSRRWLSDNL